MTALTASDSGAKGLILTRLGKNPKKVAPSDEAKATSGRQLSFNHVSAGTPLIFIFAYLEYGQGRPTLKRLSEVLPAQPPEVLIRSREDFR